MNEEGDEVVIHHDDEEDYVILEGTHQLPDLEAMRKQVRDTTSLSSMFRKELETYLGDLDHKMDSEGRHLVHVPKNFDEIVGAMTREDLLSDEPKQGNKSWYSTLLEEEVEHDMDRQFGGRYHGILSNAPDAKIKHGMAEIEMLDRQLQALASKARAMEKGSNSGGGGDEDDTNTVGSTSDTPRSRTFITKGPSRGELATRQKLIKPPKSPLPAQASTPSPTKGESAVAGESSLGEKENTRIEELLSMDDDEFGKLYAYLPDELVNENKAADMALAQYNRLDRLYTPNEDLPPDADDGKKAKSRRANYLAQQRQERMDREQELTIDNLLASCRRTYTDYSGLMADESTRGRGRPAANLLDVPAYRDLRATAPITRADIHHLLHNIAEQTELTGDCDAPSSPTCPSSSRSASSPSSEANQQGIQQLVQQYRQEIDKLEALRAAVLLNAQLSSAPSTAPDAGTTRGTSREGGRPGSRSSGGAMGYRDRLRQAVQEDHDHDQFLSNRARNDSEDKSVDQVFCAEDLRALRAVFLHNTERMARTVPPSSSSAVTQLSLAAENEEDEDDDEKATDYLPPIVDTARSEHTFVMPSSRRVHSREWTGAMSSLEGEEDRGAEVRRVAKRPVKVVI